MARKTILQKRVLDMLPSAAALRTATKPDLYDFDRDVHLQDLETEAARIGGYSALDCLRVIQAEPFSIDAYTMLAAIESLGYPNRVAVLQRGILASTILLGPNFMAEERGSFYGLLETRPHMRALKSLMDIHVEIGLNETALEIGEEIMALNANDNLGVRSKVVTMLLKSGDLVKARGVIDKYPNDLMPGVSFGAALLAFIEGREEDAARAIKRADTFQGYVVRGLLGKKLKSDATPYGVPWGGTSEAMTYIEEAKDLWHATPGAINFLKTYAKSRPEDWDRKAEILSGSWKSQRPVLEDEEDEEDEIRP